MSSVPLFSKAASKLAFFSALLVGLFFVSFVHAQTTSGTTFYSTTNSADCTKAGGEWCTNSGAPMGWCQSVGTCPPATEAACKALNRKWCTWSGMSGCAMAGQECNGNPSSMSTGSTTTIVVPNTATTTNSSGTSTSNSSSSSSSSTTAPVSQSYYTATNSADCATRGGEWCVSSMGSASGWCSTVGMCPINDQATCQAKGRKWCLSTFGMGGCSMVGYDCGPGSTEAKSTNPIVNPTPTTQTQSTPNTTNTSVWPSTKADCDNAYGLWCDATMSGASGSCMPANKTCPTVPKQGYMNCWDNSQVLMTSACPMMPSTEADCTKTGKNWCKNSGTTSGWCSVSPCESMPAAGSSQMTCPDGKTFVASFVSCPRKSSTTTTTTVPTTTATSTTSIVDQTAVKQTFAWPKSQEECMSFSGKWCGGATVGWCTMEHKTCPVVPKPGYMTCWDNSMISIIASCPDMPTNDTDCGKAGKFWCNYNVLPTGTAQAGGWCSAEPCPPAPPTGKMTCPDGRTFAATLTQCPQKNTDDLYTKCVGGTKVLKGQQCPITVQCKDGSMAVSLDQCADVKDPITQCVGSGGMWCADSAGAKTGYCGKKEMPCKNTDDKILLTEDQVATLEKNRKLMLSQLDKYVAIFVKAKNDDAIAKTKALNAKIVAVVLKDKSAYTTMIALSDEVDVIRALSSDSGSGDQKKNDEKQQARALEQLQSGVKTFSKKLDQRATQIEKLKAQGVPIDAKITDTLQKAKDVVAKILKATNYDDARSLAEDLPDIVQDINDAFDRLEQLKRLPKAIKLVDKRIAQADRVVKEVNGIAKRRSVDSGSLQSLLNLQSQAHDAAAALKAGKLPEDQDLFDYIRAEVFDPCDEIDSLAAGIRALSNSKVQLQQLDTRMRGYDRKVVALSKTDSEAAAKARVHITALKQNIKDLRVLVAKGLTIDSIDDVVQLWSDIGKEEGDLQDVLGISKPDALQLLLQTPTGSAGSSIEQLQVDNLESVIVSSVRIAQAFKSARLSPYRNLAIQ